MKKLNYLMFAAATAMFATSCSTDSLESSIPDSEKTAIEFNGESTTTVTRAGLDNSNPTKIVMQIKSQNGSNVRVTKTVASAASAGTATTDYSEVSFENSYKRYWDDAYGRSANLSVYAVAVPGKTTGSSSKATEELLAGSESWSNGDIDHTFSWTVDASQTTDNIAANDMVYSNNISDGGKSGVYAYDNTKGAYSSVLSDGMMTFRLSDSEATDGAGHFDKGHLNFKHALSRVTVNLIKGQGFTADGSFQITDGTNVTLKAMPVSGTFNLVDGTWSGQKTSDVTMATTTTASGSDHSFLSQLVPGYVITDGNSSNVLEFSVDDNQYYITQDMMFDALNVATNYQTLGVESNATSITLNNGLNYSFNITVNKTGIAVVTASLEPWVDVTASATPSNARYTFSLYDNDKAVSTTDFDLYRALDYDENETVRDDYVGTYWATGYNTDGKAKVSVDGSKISTNWYFESNRSYYHFRTVNKDVAITTDAKNGDYFTMTTGDIDYRWGATMKSDPVYSTSNGFSDYVSNAIGATSDEIHLTEEHMMSLINVVLESKDGVVLTGSKVWLTRMSESATVLMGTGLVTPSTTISDEHLMTGADDKKRLYVIPQALVRNGGASDNDYVGIHILTENGASYYFVKKFSELVAETVSSDKNQSAGKAIARWYPGHTYTYTFTLNKQGIQNVTASLTPWIEVKATGQTITLED
ncbi:fimbrillin family protein [Segatella baroniae]|uniref:fimbrillin family protein n=1 Tax=Segatella baroniae TaxID=305719 RepID=UPI0009DC29FC|nr:fimbrillin family protein [Segatella baroniae]